MNVLIPRSVMVLDPWVSAGVLEAGDAYFADWVVRSSGIESDAVVLGAALASWATRYGHACIELPLVASFVAADLAERAGSAEASETVGSLPWPEPAAWADELRAVAATAGSPVRVVEAWDAEDVLDSAPLVLRGSSLYLQRYWIDECAVASRLLARSVDTGAVLSPSAAALLDRLLPATEPDGSPNQQRRAAELVVSKRVALVAGGPGTGKTYSVARLLAVLIADAQAAGRPLRIALAAPTGKAAARLGETIGGALAVHPGEDPIDPAVAAALSDVAPSTIHRLLGSFGPNRQRFQHDATRPLPHDIVVIDETSMVSLPLLARLLEAVRPDARLVLIGDPDQLESVELGAVLGDLMRAAEAPGAGGPLSAHAVRLRRVHRFESDSPIALLADAVREGDAPGVLERLGLGEVGDTFDTGGVLRSSVRFVNTADPRDPVAVAAISEVVRPLLGEVLECAARGDGPGALAASARARVLCAHRQGPWGVSEWNERGERWLREGASATTVSSWYAGRPLLVTKNDARLGLSNGDTGVVIQREGRPLAVFPGADGLTPREFDPVQLESVETAYAMTVHKSQGSEYPNVVLILPPATSPLVGRELVYTGITRAKAHLLVVGSSDAVRACVETPAQRMTGLSAALS
jgi:exodeoxyribonuclease V alpha subunit